MAELAYATALEPVQLKVRIFLWAQNKGYDSKETI